MKRDYNNLVCCHVVDCMHHNPNDTCDAKEITINQQCNARLCENTLCQSFILNDNSHK